MCCTTSGSVPLWLRSSPSLLTSGRAVRAATAAMSSMMAWSVCSTDASMTNSRTCRQCRVSCSSRTAPRHQPNRRSATEGMQIGHPSCSIRKPSSQICRGPLQIWCSVAMYVATPRRSSHMAMGKVSTVQQSATMTRCRTCRTSPATRGACRSSSWPGNIASSNLKTKRPRTSRDMSVSASGPLPSSPTPTKSGLTPCCCSNGSARSSATAATRRACITPMDSGRQDSGLHKYFSARLRTNQGSLALTFQNTCML
mmetsp:Transcript_90418/g.264578  ORF Transcript_90418/g.264578 Transcript_90418/m.264578 type:complete len:255 (+) Transcript_90418:512-1276(+)